MSRKTERRGYVYVLHFDEPMSHAEHYVGCTTDLRQRLITHAQGRGARIVEAALSKGIGFHLGAVGECNMTKMRRLERQLKNWKGPREMCEICTARENARPECRSIPGTVSLPVAEIGFPLDSATLATLSPRFTPAMRVTSAADPLALGLRIRDLMQRDKHALGFIPAGGEKGINVSIAAGRVAVAEADGLLLGFVAWTTADEVCNIQQLVVGDPWRRCGIGRALVEAVHAANPMCHTLACRVRADLAANDAWTAYGFRKYATDTHETSGEQINCYRMARR